MICVQWEMTNVFDWRGFNLVQDPDSTGITESMWVSVGSSQWQLICRFIRLGFELYELDGTSSH